MNKLALLLHDTTILNFEKLFSLIKRYRYLVIIIPLVAAFTYYQLDKRNNKVYFQSSLLTIKSKSSQLTGFDSKLFEDQYNSPLMEFKSDVSTWHFKTLLSQKVLSYDHFNRLVLTSPGGEYKVTGESLAQSCKGERSCLIEQLNFILTGLYKIKETDLNGKGNLEVYTRDEATTYHLRLAIENALIEYRLNLLKSSFKKQKETLQEIVESKKRNIFKNGQEESWMLKEVDLKLQDTTQKLAKAESELSRMKGELTRLDLELNGVVSETAKLSESQIRQYNILKDDIEGISRNIAQLTLSGKLSDLDRSILDKLKYELRQKSKDLNRFGLGTQGRIAESSDRGQYNRKKAVILSGMAAKNAEIEELRTERQELVQESSQLSDKLRIDKVSYDYIQSLEKRLIEVKLAEATVEADVAIDSTDPSIQVLYRMRRSLVIGFSLVLGIAVWLSTVVGFFFFDNRIFSDDEIHIGEGSELEIIGETPILG